MKKRTVILLTFLLAAASCLIMARFYSDQRPQPMSLRAEKYDISDFEIEESTSPAEDAGETATDNPEPPLDAIGDTGLKFAEETGEEPETLPEQTDPLYGNPAAPRSLLLPGEAVVYNYQELKSALEGNNGITSVYFGADITMQSGGVRINPSKQQVAVSGRNPLNPDRTDPYTLTDYSSSVFTNTIYIDAAGINTVTIRDMNIIGKNFYGPVSVLDASALSGTLVIYERVNYNGPQLGYHRRGTIRIEECAVRIHGGNGGSVNQEFSEAKHLVFKGANSIDIDSSANSIFWHPLGGSFTLADDSSLAVTSPNTSALYGVFYADLSIYKVDINIGERAKLDMTISGTVAPDAYVALSSFTVRKAGRFTLRTTKAAAATVLKMAGALTVENEASFMIAGYGGASHSLLRQEGGDITVMKDAVFHITSQNAYSDLLNLVGRAFLCNDPVSVLLYNANRDITATTNPSRIYANAQQVNYWDALSAGGLDAPALYKWDKADGSNFLIDGTLSTGTKGNFIGISSNYTPGDPPGKAPDATAFSMEGARVLALGRLGLTVFQPTARSTAISGVTAPGATVRASFSQWGENYILPDVTADSMGVFHSPLNVALEKGTVVTVRCSWQFLTAADDSVVQDGKGKLEFFVPDSMEFFVTEVSPSAQIIKRLQSGWEIIVSDGRGTGSGWSLYARLDSEMTPEGPELPALEGSLVFVGGSGVVTVMSMDTDVFIASHTSAFDEEMFPVSWDEDKGILLSVKPGTAFTDTIYTASIRWTLVDAP